MPSAIHWVTNTTAMSDLSLIHIYIAGMDHDAHALGDRHGFVAADQRPLDHVVTLTVGEEPPFLWIAPAGHIGVVGLGDIGAARPGLEPFERRALSIDRQGQPFAKRLRRGAQHKGPPDLGIDCLLYTSRCV